MLEKEVFLFTIKNPALMDGVYSVCYKKICNPTQTPYPLRDKAF